MRPYVRKVWFGGYFVWLIVLIGVGLRVYQLPGQIIADDEWHALYRQLIVNYAHIATHFGYADYSIPLTLYYKLLADTIGLNELGMRLPALLAGIATPLVIPRIWRRYLDRTSYLYLVTMLSVSPLLVYFSRTARPYALTVLLASVALAACYRWWHEYDRRWGYIYLVCVTAGAYLHLASLLFTLIPIVFFGILATTSLFTGDTRPLRRLTTFGLWVLLLLAVFIGPPLYVDHAVLVTKSGMQSIRWHAITGAIRLWVGTGSHVLIVLLFVISNIGVVSLWRRHRCWTIYCIVCTVGLLVIVGASRGAGLDEAIVLARYGLPVVPVFLMLVALGLSRVVSIWFSDNGSYVVACLLAAGLFLSGPLPGQAYYPNHFMGHMFFQSEYRLESNPYRFLRPEHIPEFYRMIAEHDPASLTIIEVPWTLAWHEIRFNFFQELHRQRVRIGFLGAMCGSDWRGLTGEYPVDAKGLKFRNFVHLERVLRSGANVGDYVVFHRRSLVGGQQEREVTRCINLFTDEVGEPYYEDEYIVVFAVTDGKYGRIIESGHSAD